MEHEEKQDCSKSACCNKFLKDKAVPILLVLVATAVIFAVGYCAGSHSRFRHQGGFYGRRGGMMQRGQWGKNNEYDQTQPDQIPVDQASVVPDTTATTSTQK